MPGPIRPVPELLAPAGSLDAVRAALANGADAVYLGAERFNARDEGAQLTLDELAEACRLAHGRGARIYLTLNTLLKPGELAEALELLGEAIDRGVDAAIVQDVGLIGLIPRLYPGFELHGSTQLTVHDASGAALMRALGLQRVVLARENTLDDIAAIRTAVPELALETFIHGALCIAYSGQCLMSGMISERSANRGSCAQSCRKDYALTDDASGQTLDAGFLISARDLGAAEHIPALADLGVHTLKIEGRKKKPEYVATVTRSYRDFLERVAHGERELAPAAESAELVQIYSRGFTGGMYGGRAGRDYVTRAQPDNRGQELGVVVAWERGELVIEVKSPVEAGDGLGFEPPLTAAGASRTQGTGFAVTTVRTLSSAPARIRQAVTTSTRIPAGWTVVRSSHGALLARARASYVSVAPPGRGRRVRLDVRAFGNAGAPLKLIFVAADDEVAVRSQVELAPAAKRSLDEHQLREQLGRLGETDFALGAVDTSALAAGLFIPVSELNHLRQSAVERLHAKRTWAADGGRAARSTRIAAALGELPTHRAPDASAAWVLAADCWRTEDALLAADSGASEITLDPFLRHPVPPRKRVRSLADQLSSRGIAFRLRTPTIVRPAEREALEPWLELGLPLLSGHAGLVAELGAAGCDVVGDYALNCFNQHTAARWLALGARRLTLSVELTTDEIAALVAPWGGAGFDALVYGRPEGMTIEHCVLSATFDREPTTCRDLCVQKHPLVSITDPAGYSFPVATDAACRNRLLHSRPIEASEYLPRLWRAGVRGYRLLFNLPGDPVAALVAGWRQALVAQERGDAPATEAVRTLVGGAFTRGHFARAV